MTTKIFRYLVVILITAMLLASCAPSAQEVAQELATIQANAAPTEAATSDARAALVTEAPGPDYEATVAAQQSQLEALANQPTQTPVVELQPIPAEPDPFACVNKLYTYPANTQNILYDFEVQSQVVQMNDFYTPGNSTVIVLESPIKPEERSRYALGWGSAWGLFSDRAGCEDYDMVVDSIKYAESRLDQGHAGLVIDFREGTPIVVAMLEGMTQERIDQLWGMYRLANHDDGYELPIELAFADDIVFLTPPSPEALAAAGVCKPEGNQAVGVSVEDRNKVVLGPFDFPVNVQIWWGDSTKSPAWKDYEAGQVNFIVPTGVTYVFDVKLTDIKGGGRWDYEGCTWSQIETDVQWSGMPVYYLDEQGEWIEGMMPEELATALSDANAVIQVPPGIFLTPTPTPTSTPTSTPAP